MERCYAKLLGLDYLEIKPLEPPTGQINYIDHHDNQFKFT